MRWGRKGRASCASESARACPTITLHTVFTLSTNHLLALFLAVVGAVAVVFNSTLESLSDKSVLPVAHAVIVRDTDLDRRDISSSPADQQRRILWTICEVVDDFSHEAFSRWALAVERVYGSAMSAF